jgi:hypothetical protein
MRRQNARRFVREFEGDTQAEVPSHRAVTHLQHFAGEQPKGQVWTYDKNEGSWRSAIPDGTATFNNFYSVALEDGTYDTTVEEVLAADESDAAR